MSEVGRPADDPRRHPRKGIGADLALPLLAAVYAAYYLFTIRDYPWEARINGTVTAAILWVLVAIFVARTALRVRRGEVTLHLTGLIAPKALLPQRIGFIALTVADVALIEHLGFTLTVYLFMLFSMLLLGVRRRRVLLLMPVVVALVGYAFFIPVLDTRLPFGPIERLLAWVF